MMSAALIRQGVGLGSYIQSKRENQDSFSVFKISVFKISEVTAIISYGD